MGKLPKDITGICLVGKTPLLITPEGFCSAEDTAVAESLTCRHMGDKFYDGKELVRMCNYSPSIDAEMQIKR